MTKTLLRSQAGVRLERVKEADAHGVVVRYHLRTYRQHEPDVFWDENEAQVAFARQAAASLEDPVVQRLIASGAI